MGGIFLLAGIFFVVALIKSIKRKTPGWIVGTVLAGIVALAGFLGLAGSVASSIAKKAKSASEAGERKKRLASKDGSIRLEVPASWKEMPELNDDAVIAAGNPGREQYVVVIENPKADYAGNLEQFDVLATEMIGGKLEGAEISEPEIRKVGEYPAIHRRLKGTTQHIRVVYHVSSIETADAFCHVLTWTIPSRETAALPVLREVVESFNASARPPEEGKATPKIAAGDTQGRVAAIITDQLGVKADLVKPEARFVQDLGADSLDLVELVMAVEEEFEISIDDDVAAQLHTVGDVVRLLEKQTAAPEVE